MIKLSLSLIRFSPLWLIYVVSWIFGSLAYYFKNNQRYIAEVNLKIAYPEMSAPERNRMIRRVLVETVKNLLESVKLWQLSTRGINHLIKEVRGLAVLEQALATEKGVILLVPHLGNWEIVNLCLSQRFEITGLYRQQKSAWLDKLMFQGRGKFGAHALTADTNSVRGLMKAIKQNHIIFILPDQNPGKGAGVFAKFYGVTCLSPVLPVRLAARTGATVVYAYGERLPYARGYRINLQAARNDLAQDDTLKGCELMNQELETVINQLPDQYWWGYSRFRHRPGGEAPLYRKD